MVQTTIRMPEELHKQLKAEAKKRGLTLNAYMISILFGADGSKRRVEFAV